LGDSAQIDLKIMKGRIMLKIKIISGGQTGVDRAGLDVALELGLDLGGWCPKGRTAEDGPIPAKYPLRELPSPKYPPRTEKNVRASDGTLILTWGPVTGGTALTVKFARKHQKPYLVVDLSGGVNQKDVRDWLKIYTIKVLNIAGPKESKVPGIHDLGAVFLKEVITGIEEKTMVRESQFPYTSVPVQVNLALEMWR
jgi:hypothetical protein